MMLKLGCPGTAREAEKKIDIYRKITFMGSNSRQEHKNPAKQEMSHNMAAF